MTTKLTLTIEKSIIEKAKDYARATGRSLSDLIETYLESVVKDAGSKKGEDLPPPLKKLFGATRISPSLDHKKEIRKILGSR